MSECKTCPNAAGFKLCNQPYALCSKAKCVLNKNNVYTCYCENFKGCSMGTKKCSELKPFIDKQGRQRIFSTFSPQFGKQGDTLNTGYAKKWANCLNQKCVVDPNDPKKSICKCVVATGQEVSYNKKLENVSGASLDSFLQTAAYWESCLGQNLLKINQNAYEKNKKPENKKPENKK